MLFPQCRLYLSLLFLRSALSVLVNVTIDDTFGDPLTGAHVSYVPQGSWLIGGECTGCTTSPDSSQAYFHTWHNGTFNNTDSALLATVPFYGNAIYVYCILSMSPSNPTSDMTFFIDLVEVGSFKKEPNGTAEFLYNVLVYDNTTLDGGNHTLTIQNGHTGGTSSLTVLLDYIVYSYDDGSPTPITLPSSSTATLPSSPTGPSSGPKGVIVGATVGAITFLLLLAASGILLIHRHRTQKSPDVLVTPGLPSTSNEGDRLVAMPFTEPKGALIFYPEKPFISPVDIFSGPTGGVREFQDSSQASFPLERIMSMRPEPSVLSGSTRTERQEWLQSRINELIAALKAALAAANESAQNGTQDLRVEIERLGLLLQSDWALGLTDEPPPSYTDLLIETGDNQVPD